MVLPALSLDALLVRPLVGREHLIIRHKRTDVKKNHHDLLLLRGHWARAFVEESVDWLR
ncbi:hypothetical protein EI94DRAFT_1722744 [Lactarius quietus]|nr:hypothetical protein EI94DRAFT_1722744 [Lactarius quietus]